MVINTGGKKKMALLQVIKNTNKFIWTNERFTLSIFNLCILFCFFFFVRSELEFSVMRLTYDF